MARRRRRPPTPPTSPTPAPRPCSSREHRQFDFWLGDWDVGAAGTAAGTNRISEILGGCALREEWKGAGGLTGTSLNMWDAAERKWRQTWVDSQGSVLLLSGGRRADSMVLEGESPGGKGGMVKNRISWSPLPAGHVRQLWETSADGGKTWQAVFDGDYAPKGE